VTPPREAGYLFTLSHHAYRVQADPLVHHGRHFGRAVFAFTNMHALILAGLGMDEDDVPDTQQYV
jgi:hypothetical protein